MLMHFQNVEGYDTWVRPGSVICVGAVPDGSVKRMNGQDLVGGYIVHIYGNIQGFVNRETALRIVEEVNKADVRPGDEWRGGDTATEQDE